MAKIVREPWKIFGAKSAEALTGGIPVDWDAAVEVAREVLKA
jgi:hypothetical protein